MTLSFTAFLLFFAKTLVVMSLNAKTTLIFVHKECFLCIFQLYKYLSDGIFFNYDIIIKHDLYAFFKTQFFLKKVRKT